MSSPTGDANAPATQVRFSPAEALLYAGTTSAAADSGLFVSTDYTSFAGLTFIEVSSLAHVSLSKFKIADSKNWFIMLTDDVNGNDSPPPGDGTDDSYRLFASYEAGTTWKQLHNNGNVAMDSVNYTAPILKIKHSISRRYVSAVSGILTPKRY